MIKEIFQKLLRGETIPEEEQLKLLQWVEQAEAGNRDFIYETIVSSIRQLFPRVSDITHQLGLQIAGEFRSGNGKAPGDGFTGGRFGYPGFTYGGTEYFLAGVSNDVLQVGLALADGKVYAGGGDVVIDQFGLSFLNQEGDLTFEDTSGNRDTINIYSDASDELVLNNAVGGKAIRLDIDNASHNVGGPSFTYDGIFFGNDLDSNAFQISNTPGTNTVFNDGNGDIDLIIRGDTASINLISDAGLDAIGIGGAAESGYKLKVTGAQRITGNLKVAGIENDAGLAAGTYTPTVTGVANVDSASSGGGWIYQRVGNTVTVAGIVNVDATAVATTTDARISLPVASNFAATTDCTGTGGVQGSDDVATILGDATNNEALLRFTANVTTNQAFRVMFMYVVI